MSRLYFAFIILLLGCACSQNETLPEPMFDSVSQPSNKRTMQEICDIALNVSQAMYPQSRGHQLSVSTEPIYYLAPGSRGQESDTLLCFVNYDNDQGFAIIPTNRYSTACLGIIEEGNFSMEDLEQPGFGEYIEYACDMLRDEEIVEVEEDNAGISSGTIIEKREIKHVKQWDYLIKKGPYVKVAWGQDGVEGAYCPNGISGCVMTACAQLLSYYELPTTINLTFPEKDCTSTTLNWSAIKTHVHDHSINLPTKPDPLYGMSQDRICVATEKDHKDIGRLCRQIGYDIDANYRFDGYGTGVEIGYAINYLSTNWLKNYSCNDATDSTRDSIINVLSQGPAMVSGKGHTWVADGYIKINVYNRTYSRTSSVDPWKLDDEVFIEQKELVHMNWGWDGRSNGYFDPRVYDSDNAYEYDYDTSSVDKEYTPKANFYYFR